MLKPLDIVVICALPAEFVSAKHKVWYSGVGKINATIATMKAIREFKPELVINVGTVGSCLPTLTGGIECSRFYERDGVRTMGENAVIVDQDEEKYTCATGDSFLTRPLSWADVVDMEAFAIAKVCQVEGVDFRCFKYVTDYVGENSLKIWSDNISAGQHFFAGKLEEVIING